MRSTYKQISGKRTRCKSCKAIGLKTVRDKHDGLCPTCYANRAEANA